MKRLGFAISVVLVALLAISVVPVAAQNSLGTTTASVAPPKVDLSTVPPPLITPLKNYLMPPMPLAPPRAAASNNDSFPRFDVYMGYSFLSNEIAVVDDGDFEQLVHGYAASAAFNFNKSFGILADFSGHNGSMTRSGTHQTEDQYYFLFGPVISHSFGKARISGHVTVGVAKQHYGENFSGESHFNVKESNFAVGVGGAFDWMFTDRWGWRVLQVDYLMSDFTFERVHNVRGSTGLIVRF